LVEHVAAAVRAAAGSVVLIGSPDRYRHLGLPVLADLRPGSGPLGGIETALASTAAEWNLVLACDLPEAERAFLASLLEAATRSGADCLLPIGPTGLPEPLCAVYHRRCLPSITAALDAGRFKITDALAALQVARHEDPATPCFRNVNTPADWAVYKNG
ncbi:MAG: molybdenum cofactor guanylyltransferase, partial [Bryobacteraceae bacterium]